MKEAGSVFGLGLILNVRRDEYYGATTYQTGFKILIHHQGTPPLVSQLGFAVGPGTSTFAAIRKQRVRNYISLLYWAQLFKGWIESYPVDKYYQKLLSYPMDSAIHPLNNWGLMGIRHLFTNYENQSSITIAVCFEVSLAFMTSKIDWSSFTLQRYLCLGYRSVFTFKVLVLASHRSLQKNRCMKTTIAQGLFHKS